MRLLWFISWLVLLYGCGNTPCASGSLYFNLVGFSDAEAQDIILRRYTKGQNFSQKIDTSLIRYSFKRMNDTLEVTSLVGNSLLWPQYDYEIVFPLASKLYRVTNINEIQKSMKHSIFNPKKDGCINEIINLTINGQVTPARFNIFYLHK